MNFNQNGHISHNVLPSDKILAISKVFINR